MVRSHLKRLESGIIPNYRSFITVVAAGPVVVTVEVLGITRPFNHKIGAVRSCMGPVGNGVN